MIFSKCQRRGIHQLGNKADSAQFRQIWPYCLALGVYALTDRILFSIVFRIPKAKLSIMHRSC